MSTMTLNQRLSFRSTPKASITCFRTCILLLRWFLTTSAATISACRAARFFFDLHHRDGCLLPSSTEAVCCEGCSLWCWAHLPVQKLDSDRSSTSTLLLPPRKSMFLNAWSMLANCTAWKQDICDAAPSRIQGDFLMVASFQTARGTTATTTGNIPNCRTADSSIRSSISSDCVILKGRHPTRSGPKLLRSDVEAALRCCAGVAARPTP